MVCTYNSRQARYCGTFLAALAASLRGPAWFGLARLDLPRYLFQEGIRHGTYGPDSAGDFFFPAGAIMVLTGVSARVAAVILPAVLPAYWWSPGWRVAVAAPRRVEAQPSIITTPAAVICPNAEERHALIRCKL